MCVCVCINSVHYCYGAIEQINLIAVKETNKALQGRMSSWLQFIAIG